MPDFEFGDFDKDDVFTVGDEEIDWTQLDRLGSQIDSIQAIEDPEARLQAAKDWAAELQGDR